MRICNWNKCIDGFLDAIVRQNGQFGAKAQSAKNIHTKYDPRPNKYLTFDVKKDWKTPDIRKMTIYWKKWKMVIL